MHNFLGNTFQVGDFVAYPVRKGSSLWMSFGIVYKLETVRKYECDILRIGAIIVQFGQWRFPYDHNNLSFYDFADKCLFAQSNSRARSNGKTSRRRYSFDIGQKT